MSCALYKKAWADVPGARSIVILGFSLTGLPRVKTVPKPKMFGFGILPVR